MSSAKPDLMKELHEILEPDERSNFFARHNPITQRPERLTIKDIHESISRFMLHEQVPVHIRESFDTARNLYLYSWFVYRFRNVAEGHVLSTLEYCLRERIGKNELKIYKERRKKTSKDSSSKISIPRDGLKLYIEYCRDHKLITNHGFSAWRRIPIMRKEQEFWHQKHLEMIEKGLTEISYEMPDFSVSDDDNDFDYIQHLVDTTHTVRNIYAHGTGMVYPSVLYTFEMVSEFINQLYPTSADNK